MTRFHKITQWLPIPSAPGYYASEDGQIRKESGRLLAQNPSGRYATATIFGGAKPKTRYVHALVCEAFHGPRPSLKHQVAHNDGTKRNNAASNLRWATPSENQMDCKLHGTCPLGSKKPRAKLTEAQAAQIKQTYADNMGVRYVKRGTREALARQYGVSISIIKAIIAGTTWKHVSLDLPFLPPPSDRPF